MRVIIAIILLGITIVGCSKQQPRKPKSKTDNTFIKESIERNKILIAEEEKLIEAIIEKDTLQQYIASTKGYWYKYENKVEAESPLAQKGDIAYFEYEVRDLDNKIIYTKEELKLQEYYVDKENIMMGLRDGIKLMKKGESITFIFPSHMGYGYHGDNNKISTNEPLICTVTLTDLKKDPKPKN
jgi:gliding motility-associated peptidyl-prolyl isomerase